MNTMRYGEERDWKKYQNNFERREYWEDTSTKKAAKKS